jgi:hypothetical protein
MLRFIILSLAFGLPPLFHLVSRFELKYKRRIMSTVLRVGVLGLMFTGVALVPEYQQMQGTVLNEFRIADDIASHYQDGGIVVDMPSMVYRLSSKHGVESEDIISNHYSPYYYGVTDPAAYFEWLRKENVTV